MAIFGIQLYVVTEVCIFMLSGAQPRRHSHSYSQEGYFFHSNMFLFERSWTFLVSKDDLLRLLV
jgi:hypothetical protein